MKYIFAVLLTIIAIGICILAYGQIYGLLTPVVSPAKVETSYADIVVILLTTVTVIFTVAALALGVLAFVGPRALKREAGKYAEAAVVKSIDDALKVGGSAAKLMEASFPPNDGPMKDWMEQRVERHVISLLPLIMDRVGVTSKIGTVDPDVPDDEGQVD